METAALDERYRRLAQDHRRLYRTLGVLPLADTDPELAGVSTFLSLETATDGLAALADEGLLVPLAPDAARPHRYAMAPHVRGHARHRFHLDEHPLTHHLAVRGTAEWLLKTAACAQAQLTPSQSALNLRRGLPPLNAPFGEDNAPGAAAWLASQAPNLPGVLRAAASWNWEHTWRLASAWWPLFQRQPPTGPLWDTVHRIGLRAAHRAGDKAAMRQMALSRAIGLRANGRLDEAASLCLRVLEQAAYYGDRRDLGQAQLELGRCHLARGHAEDAFSCVTAAVTAWDVIGYRRGTALAHLTLSDIAPARQRPRDVRLLIDTALDVLRTHGDAYDRARALALRGRALVNEKAISAALADLTEAESLFAASGGLRWQARALGLRGDAHHHVGQHRAARMCYRKAACLGAGRWPEADRFRDQADALRQEAPPG